MKKLLSVLSYIALRGILIYLYSIGTGAVYNTPSEFLVPFFEYMVILIGYVGNMVLFEVLIYESICKEKRIRNPIELLISIILLCMYIAYYIVPIVAMIRVFGDKINVIGAIMCIINYNIISYIIRKSRKK